MMIRSPRQLIFLLVWLGMSISFAVTSHAHNTFIKSVANPIGKHTSFPIEPYKIGPELKEDNPSQHLYYFKDSDNLTIHELITQPQSNLSWIKNTDNVLNLGFTSSYYWFRMDFHNATNESIRKLLEIPYALLDVVAFYEVKDGVLINQNIQGNLVPFSNRIYNHRHYLYPVELNTGKFITVYIHIKGSASMQVPMMLWSYDYFWQQDQWRFGLQTAYIGFMLVMMFYHLFLAWGTRDNIYIIYIANLASLLIFNSAYYGVPQQFLLPISAEWNAIVISIPPTLASLFILIFARKMLETKDLLPRVDRALKYLAWILILLIPIIGSIPLHLAMQLTTLAVILSVTTVLIVAIKLWRICKPEGRIFTIAYSTFIMGSIAMGLNKFGLIPAGIWSNAFVQIGTTIEIILLSLALAARINRLKSDSIRLIKAEMEVKEAQLITQQKINEGKAKTQFFALMSHELRTPLTAILGYSEAGQELKHTDKESLNHFKSINRNGKHLLTLINDVLDLSKIEAQKIETENIPTKILPLIDDLKDTFSIIARDKGIAFKINICFPVPLTIESDPTRLKQILFNLCSNAIKFTRDGTVTVKVICDRNNGTIQFHVNDTGIGITTDQLKNLFQPFSQAEKSTTRNYGGTGLGLYLSKQLANKLGGDIEVESEYGRGSCFKASVGTGSLVNTQWIHSSEDLVNYSLEDVVGIPQFDAQILCVDDNPDCRKLMGQFLEKTGAEVLFAEDGKEALLLCRDKEFDLVITDIHMPRLDGLKLVNSLQKDYPSLPVIAVTATILESDLRHYKQVGFKKVLTKPIDSKQLYNTLSLCLTDPTQGPIENDKDGSPTEDTQDIQVLIAEDNLDIQAIIKHHLTKLSCDVCIVPDGEEAVKEATSSSFDLILMDIQMPKMDGLEATRLLRKMNCQQRIFVLTADDSEACINDAKAAGCNGHLSKPIEFEKMRQLIQVIKDEKENRHNTHKDDDSRSIA